MSNENIVYVSGTVRHYKGNATATGKGSVSSDNKNVIVALDDIVKTVDGTVQSAYEISKR